MRLELIIIIVIAGLVFNAYHNNKYSKAVMAYKKYFQMIIYGVIGLSIYIMIKKNPVQSKNMLLYTNNLIKYMPIDKSSLDIISPIFDLTSNQHQHENPYAKSFMEGFNTSMNPNTNYAPLVQRNMFTKANGKATKRSVSETKKKYVAFNQDWKCGSCGSTLNHTFEVDHKIRLEHGGSNDASNLVALCRECHGKKTAMENM